MCGRSQTRVEHDCRRQRRDSARRHQRQERLQRGRDHRRRHRAAIPGHPHDRRRSRPAVSATPTKRRRAASRSSAADATTQLFGSGNSIGETRPAERHAVHRHRQDPEEGSGQQLQRPRQRQGVRPVHRDGARLPASRRARRRAVEIIVAPKDDVVAQLPAMLDRRTGRIEDIDWPLEREVRRVLARQHGFDPADRDAVACGTRRSRRIMFGRMIQTMKDFFTIVGLVTLSLGGSRRHEHHAGRRAGADARDRRPQGAWRDDGTDPAAVLPRGIRADAAQRRGGFLVALGLCAPREPRADAGAVRGDDPDVAGRRSAPSPRSSSSASSPRPIRRAGPRCCRRSRRCGSNHEDARPS